jgi:hypothetical protein
MFGKAKKLLILKNENSILKKIIEDYENPLSLGVGLTATEWDVLTEDERIMKIRKLDLVLSLKKIGRWNYQKNCAKLH